MKRYVIHTLVIAVCAATLLTSGVCQQLPAKSASQSHAGRQLVSRPVNTLAQLSDSLQNLASKVSPAVAQIEVSGFGPALDGDRKQTALIVRHHAVGAGVIVDPDGYIMTNAHVVQGAQRIRVVLSNANTAFNDVPGSGKVQVVDAKVVGLQKETDLALLKVEAKNLPTLHFRLDHPAQPGELVFAVGSPDGLQNSVTMGVISSAWRQLDPDNPDVLLANRRAH